MKNVILLLLFTNVCFYIKAQEIPQAKTLRTLTPIEEPTLQRDSLNQLRSSIFEIIKPFVQTNDGKPVMAFSICIATDDKGNFDTIFVSDNMKGELRHQLSKSFNTLATRELVMRARAKGWYDTYIIFPVIFFYEDSQKQRFGDLFDNWRGNLVHAFSFDALQLSVTAKKIVLANPIGGVFSIAVR